MVATGIILVAFLIYFSFIINLIILVVLRCNGQSASERL